MVDFKKLAESMRENVRLGKLAKDMKSIIDDELSGLSDDNRDRVWKKILELTFGHDDREVRERISPMNYDEARQWYRSHKIEFGKYKGETLVDVPPSYLEWLDAQPDFRSDLHRFLMSSYWKQHRGNDIDG